jgi:hypothetical protein
MDVLSLSGILNVILMKAQQERAFLSLLLQERRRRIFTPSSAANKTNLDASP